MGRNCDEGAAVIYNNLCKSDVSVHPYMGFDYDPETNTIILINVKMTNNCFVMHLNDLGNVNIKVIGECEMAGIRFTDCRLKFTGSGVLTIDPNFPVLPENDPENYGHVELEPLFGCGDIGLSFDSDVTVHIVNSGSDDVDHAVCGRFELSDSDDPAGFFSTKGRVSAEPDWEYREIDNSGWMDCCLTSQYYIKTVFPVEKLKTANGGNGYWIPVGKFGDHASDDQAVLYRKLIEVEGIWMTSDDPQDAVISVHTDSETLNCYSYSDCIKDDFCGFESVIPVADFSLIGISDYDDIPDTLVDNAQCTVLIESETSFPVYTMDDEDYILCSVSATGNHYLDHYGTGSDIYNGFLEPIDPPATEDTGYHYDLFSLRAGTFGEKEITWIEFIERISYIKDFSVDMNENGRYLVDSVEYDSFSAAQRAKENSFRVNSLKAVADKGLARKREFKYVEPCSLLFLNNSSISFLPSEKSTPDEPTQVPTELPSEPTDDTPKVLSGDVDGDGEVSVLDSTIIRRVLASLIVERFNDKAADADGDDEISILDATAIQRYLAGLPSHEYIGRYIK